MSRAGTPVDPREQANRLGFARHRADDRRLRLVLVDEQAAASRELGLIDGVDLLARRQLAESLREGVA